MLVGRYWRVKEKLCAVHVRLRAAMSMARFWRDQGKREEGFDTLDLKEVKALLNELET
jgi:hypothetical protein